MALVVVLATVVGDEVHSIAFGDQLGVFGDEFCTMRGECVRGVNYHKKTGSNTFRSVPKGRYRLDVFEQREREAYVKGSNMRTAQDVSISEGSFYHRPSSRLA